MPKLEIYQDGNKTAVQARHGEILIDALRRSGIYITAPCGGKGTCGKCAVKAFGKLSSICAEETAALGEQGINSGLRLACRAKIEGDAAVKITNVSTSAKVEQGTALQGYVENPLFEKYGVVVDIGTTTLAARLYGQPGLLAHTACINPQAAYGADVVSRIEACLAGQGEDIALTIRTALDSIIENLARQAGIEAKEIDCALLTGNTAMLYLLCKENPEHLARAPFEPVRLFGETTTAEKLGLKSMGTGKVYLPHCISAFVGADTVTALISSGIPDRNSTEMLVDIGTNGEIALCCNGRLYVSSTAAGPAFEGAGIYMGMQGTQGAIEHVRLADGVIYTEVIGDVKPSGICGSGIIDTVAVMLEAEVLEESGYISECGHGFEKNICEVQGETAFSLADGVVFTQKDIRMVQLAKSSIFAGASTLLEHAGIKAEDLDTLLVAGGFGSYMDMENAVRIGLLPRMAPGKTVVLGNAALDGAAMLMLDKSLWNKAGSLAREAETISLAGNNYFADIYMQSMIFEN